MNDPVPTSKGWYPDSDTGGTKYWDGYHWTGDRRPSKRPFAAPSWQPENLLYAAMPGLFGMLSWMNSTYFLAILLLLASAAAAVFILRGQGPSTPEIELRLAKEEEDAKARRRAANISTFAAGVGQLFKRTSTAAAPVQPSESATAAQIRALANPQTAKALQDLQNLLYTRAITDQEFQAAKDRLIGSKATDDSFAQVAKLAELHRAGILGDVEFAAAKAKALGI